MDFPDLAKYDPPHGHAEDVRQHLQQLPILGLGQHTAQPGELDELFRPFPQEVGLPRLAKQQQLVVVHRLGLGQEILRLLVGIGDLEKLLYLLTVAVFRVSLPVGRLFFHLLLNLLVVLLKYPEVGALLLEQLA